MAMRDFDSLYETLKNFAEEKLLFQGDEVCRCVAGDLYDEFCEFSGKTPTRNYIFPRLMDQFIADQEAKNEEYIANGEPEVHIYKHKNQLLYYYGITLASSPDYPDFQKNKLKRNRGISRNNRNYSNRRSVRPPPRVPPLPDVSANIPANIPAVNIVPVVEVRPPPTPITLNIKR